MIVIQFLSYRNRKTMPGIFAFAPAPKSRGRVLLSEDTRPTSPHSYESVYSHGNKTTNIHVYELNNLMAFACQLRPIAGFGCILLDSHILAAIHGKIHYP